MRNWWNQREPREQLLLLIAAIVATAALLVQGVLMPSLHKRDAAAQSVADAESTLVRLSRLSTAGMNHAGEADENAAQFASEWAAEAGLVQRGVAQPESDLRFAFDPATPTIVFSWIDRVETSLGLTVQSAEMTSSGGGQVEATIEYSGDPAP